jgi:SAM-dependent methyltransferase
MIDARRLQHVLGQFGFSSSEAETEKMLAGGFAEPFLQMLGARAVTSFDAANFENPSVVHDFNNPIPDEFKNKFSVVLDGGTLEHVFNFPAAIKNCMEMVKVGGHFLGISPANNHMGHGFYQFSPELFFRVFSRQNGFEVEQILIFEETPAPEWFEVSDPNSINERVVLMNDQPSLMLIIAKKIEAVEIFKEFPQQSDYVARWEEGQGDDFGKMNGNASRRNLSFERIWRLPFSTLRRAQTKINRRYGMLNKQKKHFKKINPF